MTFPPLATSSCSSGTTVRTSVKTCVSFVTLPRSGTKLPRHFTSPQPRSGSSKRTIQVTNQVAYERSSSSGSLMAVCYPRLGDTLSTGGDFITCCSTLSRAIWRLLSKVHCQQTAVTYVRHFSVREYRVCVCFIEVFPSCVSENRSSFMFAVWLQMYTQDKQLREMWA